MRKITTWEAGLALILLLSIAGCAVTYQAPGVVEIHRMSELDGEPLGTQSPLTPVILDVYDRSISAEVYSDQ